MLPVGLRIVSETLRCCPVAAYRTKLKTTQGAMKAIISEGELTSVIPPLAAPAGQSSSSQLNPLLSNLKSSRQLHHLIFHYNNLQSHLDQSS